MHLFSALSVVFCVAWLLIGSMLFYYTWNLVICAQFPARKNISYAKSLLLLFTIAVLLAPCYYKKKGYYGKKGYSHSKQCGHRYGKGCSKCDKSDCKHKKGHYGKKDWHGKECSDCEGHNKQGKEAAPAQ